MAYIKKDIRDYTTKKVVDWKRIVGKRVIIETPSYLTSESNYREEILEDFMLIKGIIYTRFENSKDWLSTKDYKILYVYEKEKPVDSKDIDMADLLKKYEEMAKKQKEAEKQKDKFPERTPYTPIYPWNEPSPRHPWEYPEPCYPSVPTTPSKPYHEPYKIWCNAPYTLTLIPSNISDY